MDVSALSNKLTEVKITDESSLMVVDVAKKVIEESLEAALLKVAGRA